MDINTKIDFNSLMDKTAIKKKTCHFSDYEQILTNVQLSCDLDNMLLVVKQELEIHQQKADSDCQIFCYVDNDGIVHITDTQRYNHTRIICHSNDIKLIFLAYLRKHDHNNDIAVYSLLCNMTVNDLLNELNVLDKPKKIDSAPTQSSNCWSSFLAGLKSLLSIIFCCWLCGRHDSSTESSALIRVP